MSRIAGHHLTQASSASELTSALTPTELALLNLHRQHHILEARGFESRAERAGLIFYRRLYRAGRIGGRDDA